MRKEMTPCERLGYKVGDEFEVISHHAFKKGQVVTLHEDDGTECPLFAGDGGGAGVFDGVECSFATLNKQVRKIANKLKPAKQALADAIHQNGGWADGAAAAIFGKETMTCAFLMDWALPVSYNPERGSWSVISSGVISVFKMKPFVNWHQFILYREEYFTAYPEQVKVEVNNETKRKVETEMKSEPEMTIKVSDWHKNGELPPVGEVCEAYIDYPPQWVETEIVAHKDGFAIGWCKSVMKGCHGDKAHEFRPLRTEREKAIDEMVSLVEPLATYREFAGTIYDAGMYKEVK